MSKKYNEDGDYIMKWDLVILDKDWDYEEDPITIFDRDTKKLIKKEIHPIKV